MSLPPGFLEELRNRVSIADVVGRKVTWDARKSNPGKGDYWAPCPFHAEKTASFHVEDRKGFYYCFGCHAKGDALGFVRETENVGFMDAVEILAREAGMTLPARDPKAREKADAQSRLAGVMEQAVQLYRLALKTSAAQEARAYLDRRGLRDAALERFEIGFAPSARTHLTEALLAKGVAVEDIIAAGLAIKPDDGGAPYDRFRGRIMFPIRDARGQTIAFGGRAMDPNARAKYLNSNETALFDKGRALYNHGPAREASGKTGRVIVAEGYMDVIALVGAGFADAVAPLGTAITPDQLALMWRMADEPVIALDGDKAGLRAANRLIDIALPLLSPGKSLRFCILPQNMDPDDLIKAEGPGAMAAALEGAKPMVDLLWAREIEGHVLDSPERRAALDQRLREALAKIPDLGLREHYKAALRDRRQALFQSANTARKPGPAGRSWRPKGVPQGPLPGTKASALAQSDAAQARLREQTILAQCLARPSLIERAEDLLERMEPSTPELKEFLACLLSEENRSLDQGDLHAVVAARTGRSLDQMLAPRPSWAQQDEETALRALRMDVARHLALVEDATAEAETEEDLRQDADERLTFRQREALVAKEKLARAHLDEAADQGADERHLSDHLQNLLDAQIWVKKQR
ncbi:MAG: DNA primase [Pseudomonadota bacterium]